MDKCQPCRFFRGASSRPGERGYQHINCNFPRNGSEVYWEPIPDVFVEGIRIRNGEQSETQYRDTMLHEVLHAVVAQTYSHKAYAKDDEEQAVAVMATHLLDTLRRNPEFVAYLLEDAS